MKKKHKRIILIVVSIFCLYLVAGLVARSMNMTYSTRLDGYFIEGTSTIETGSELQAEEVIDALTREPTVVELIFEPADKIFRSLGL